MWVVEVWIKPIRGPRRELIKPGRWERVGKAESFEEAKEAVIGIAAKHGTAKATKKGAKWEEVQGMRASRLGFAFWTGNGGSLGG